MADTTYYLDNGVADDTGDGESWANRKKTMAAVMALATESGDVIRVAHDSTESIDAPATWNATNSTNASPLTVVSVDSATSGTTYKVAAGVQFTTTGSYDITLDGDGWHFIGTSFKCGDDFALYEYMSTCIFDDCTFELDAFYDTQGASYRVFRNCAIKAVTTIYPFYIAGTNTGYNFIGCTFDLPNLDSSDYVIYQSGADHSRCSFDACDFYNGNANTIGHVARAPDSGCKNQRVLVRNCSLADGQVLTSGTFDVAATNTVHEMSGCYTDTDTELSPQYQRTTNAGEIVDDPTTILTTGPATDGVNEYSWEMTAVATASNGLVLEAAPIVKWVAAGSHTVTIYFTSTATLTAADFWVELLSPNETASPWTAENIFASSKADYLATTDSHFSTTSDIWDGTTTDWYKAEFSITPTVAGWVTARCFLAKASAVVYVHPKIEVVTA